MVTELFQFLLTHWMLSTALLVIIILLILEESKNRVGGGKISLHDATVLVNRQQGIWIDLRDLESFNQGHIINALHFPAEKIMEQLAKLKKYQAKPIILVDQSGIHATKTASQLRKQGFNQVYVLVGGLRNWITAGLPLKTIM